MTVETKAPSLADQLLHAYWAIPKTKLGTVEQWSNLLEVIEEARIALVAADSLNAKLAAAAKVKA